jgi:hypothetical protein
VYKVLVGKPERKRLLRRPRCRWEGEIRMYLRVTGCGLVQDRYRWQLASTYKWVNSEENMGQKFVKLFFKTENEQKYFIK